MARWFISSGGEIVARSEVGSLGRNLRDFCGCGGTGCEGRKDGTGDQGIQTHLLATERVKLIHRSRSGVLLDRAPSGLVGHDDGRRVAPGEGRAASAVGRL